MTEPTSRQSLADAVAAEHLALRAEIRRLNRDLDELQDGLSGEPIRQKLLADLRGFRAHLQRHFQLEERNGYVGGATVDDPGTVREVADLVGEHRRFELDTQDLIERLAEAAAGRGELAGTFETELRTLLGRLAIHESKEDALSSNG